MEALGNTIRNEGDEFVIVDTLVKASPEQPSSNDIFRADYRQIETLRRVAEENDLSLLVVAHTRKHEAGYSLGAIAGTGGLTAALG